MHSKIAITLSALLLAGCSTTKPIGSIVGGECNLPGVHTPPYVIKGKTSYDTRWSEDVTEGLVRGCGQERPKPRPPSLDKPTHHRAIKKKPAPISEAPAVAQPAAVPVETKSNEVIAPKPAKKHWWQRLRRKPSS